MCLLLQKLEQNLPRSVLSMMVAEQTSTGVPPSQQVARDDQLSRSDSKFVDEVCNMIVTRELWVAVSEVVFALKFSACYTMILSVCHLVVLIICNTYIYLLSSISRMPWIIIDGGSR